MLTKSVESNYSIRSPRSNILFEIGSTGAVLSFVGLTGAGTGGWSQGVYSYTFDSGAELLVQADGSYEYLSNGVWAMLDTGETVQEVVGYTITDEYGATDTATLTLTITGTNQAPVAVADYAITGQRGSLVEAARGVLTNDLGPEPGDVLHVSGVPGATPETVFDITPAGLVGQPGYRLTGSDGGEFVIAEDGSWRFDAGHDFDDLIAGTFRETTVQVEVSDGSLTALAPLTVRVEGGAFVPVVLGSGPAPLTALAAPMATATALPQVVAGTFQQLGGVDIVSELQARFEAFTGVDLDDLLDFDILDIDTTVHIAMDPDPDIGLTIDFTDNNPDSTALLTGFGDELNLAASYVTGLTNGLLNNPLTPVVFSPTFDITARFGAQLGWDIDLPSLGKTAVTQPVAFDLLLPGSVAAYETFEIETISMTSKSPTTTVQSVGLGSVDIFANFGLTELVMSDLGVMLATSDFLGADLDGLLRGLVQIDHDFDILADTGLTLEHDAANSLSGLVSLDFKALINGLSAFEFSDFQDLVIELASNNAKENARELAMFFAKALAAVQAGAVAPVPVDGALLLPADLQALHDRALFNEYDLWRDGVGYFELEREDGSLAEVTGQIISDVRDATGLTDTIGELRTLINEGFSALDGLKLFADLPVGNIDQIEGFVNDGAGGIDTADRDGTAQIEVTQVTRLAGVEIDYEKLSPELQRLAIDIATEVGVKAATAQPYLIPVIVGANIAANAQLLVQEEAKKTFEEGFTLDTEITAIALATEVINTLADLFNGVGGVVNTVLGQVQGTTGFTMPVIPTIPQVTETTLGAAFDGAVDLFASGLVTVLTGIAEVAAEVTSVLLDDPLVDGILDALEVIKTAVSSTISDVVSGITAFAQGVQDILGIDLGFITDFLNSVSGVINAGEAAWTSFNAFLSDLRDAVVDFTANLGGDIEAGITLVADTIKDIARGIDLQLSTDFDLIKFGVEAGLDLVQVATFDPDEVSVSYSVDGLGVETQVGDTAQFFANGGPGDILEGQAVYSFSGDVDYDYILRLDFVPEFELFGTHFEGSVAMGEDGDEISFDFPYAAVALTDDFRLADLGTLDPTELFDDALIELPFGLLEDVAEAITETVQQNFGWLTGQTPELAYNEIRLFAFEDVEIAPDRFTEIVQDFTIPLTGAPFAPVQINLLEEAGLQFAANALSDGLVGKLLAVEGAAGNLGRWMALGDGEVLVDTDGQLAFDSLGAYEHLAVGEEAVERLAFTFMGTDNLPKVYTAELRIAGQNDPVTAVDDLVSMDEDGVLTFDPTGNDTDVDLADIPHLRVTSASADIGDVQVGAGGAFTYAPPSDWHGVATIAYVVTDGNGSSDTGTVTVTVAPVNDAPIAGDDAFRTHENGGHTVDVTLNDIDPDGDALEILSFTQPAKGLLQQVSPTALRFHPLHDFESLSEVDAAGLTATVTVVDPHGATAVATITIEVEGRNDAPEGTDDEVAVLEDDAVTFDPAVNDFDIDGDSLVVVGHGMAGQGAVVRNADGTLTYTPDADYHGPDSFTYTVSDGHGATDVAQVAVTVQPVVERYVTGTDLDDVFEVQGSSGEATGFDGGAGFDTIVNIQPGETFSLSESTFAGIERIDGAGARLSVKRGSFADLSSVAVLDNVIGIIGNDGDERITGSQSADVIEGRAGDDILSGAGGDDVIKGQRGNDRLDGGAGADTLLGGAGDDVIQGGRGSDLIEGGAGADTLRGGLGDDTFNVSGAAARGDLFAGGDGYDVVANTIPFGFLDLTGARFDGIEELDMDGGVIVFRGDVLDLSSLTLTDLGGSGSGPMTRPWF